MGVPDILRVTQLSLVDHQFVTYMMRYLKPDPARRNVHIWSDRERLMRSRSHKIWWRVKGTFEAGFEGTT
jgi:hypothetical protein